MEDPAQFFATTVRANYLHNRPCWVRMLFTIWMPAPAGEQVGGICGRDTMLRELDTAENVCTYPVHAVDISAIENAAETIRTQWATGLATKKLWHIYFTHEWLRNVVEMWEAVVN